MIKRLRISGWTIAVVAALAAGCGWATADTTGASGAIHACVAKQGGTLGSGRNCQRSQMAAPFALPASTTTVGGGSGHLVRVLDSQGQQVAIFRSAKCRVHRSGFFSDAFSAGYHLTAFIDPFSGFHHYRLSRGHFAPQYVSLTSPSGVQYASDFVPPYPVPGEGAINFSRNGRLMGVGFSPMFSEDGSDAVTVAGVLVCKYPKRKR
jgi:hypothetical protein